MSSFILVSVIVVLEIIQGPAPKVTGSDIQIFSSNIKKTISYTEKFLKLSQRDINYSVLHKEMMTI